MINLTLDHITFIIVSVLFVPFYTWRSILASHAARWGKFTYCIILSLFVIRLSYLRVATNSGLNGFNNPANLSFTKELGDPAAFLLCVLILFGAAIYRLIDDERYIKQNYIKRSDVEKEVDRQVGIKLKLELQKRGLS